ncbi:MAG: rod shape-determining protein RodA [Acidimicrobiia bacterium]|nr:rod shape-determining protein RodA [Acidimicrobiia bacterium]
MTARLDSLNRDPTSPARHVDWSLVLVALGLTLVGAAMIYSATKGSGPEPDTAYLTREVVWIVLAVPVGLVSALVDYRRLREWSFVGYPLTVLALGAVLFIGSNRKGAQAWFAFGPFQLQPSEPAKIVLVVVLAAYLAERRGSLGPRALAGALALAGLPMLLILRQPDLGTMLVFVVVTVGMLAVAGVPARYLAALVVVGVVGVGGVLSSDVLADYQRDRLRVFISEDVGEGAQAEAYNLAQSKIAFSLGGLTGLGYGQGPQTQNDYVPEQQTDFIFTVVGEELGFVGAATVLVLFVVLTMRILRAAHLARDDFGALLCIGVLVMIVFQVFQNVGMSMGIMPITGIPLPFLSYGGSSLITTAAGIGLVQNVNMHRLR